jgi:electron transfer flavoprotein alpha subunit
MLCTARRIAAHQLRGRVARPTVSPVAFFSPAALRRLASTLAVLEQKEGKLNHGSLSAITAAQKVGGPVHGFVAGSNIKPVADEAATADGVERIIAVDNGAYDKVYIYIRRPSTWN